MRRKYKFGTDGRELLAAQGYKCKTCHSPLAYSKSEAKSTDKVGNLDHCHETGLVRAWLCGRCNTIVGFLEGNVAVAASCARYALAADELREMLS